MRDGHALFSKFVDMAPETIRCLREDIEVSYGVDVWGLGVVLFEFIHGRTPFTRRHILADWENRDTCEYDACLRLTQSRPLFAY
jgi:serine/threonine protein kinase|eukprot:COSAG02_NODE_10628_length_1895_cov_1.721047_3_plen_84_part_00